MTYTNLSKGHKYDGDPRVELVPVDLAVEGETEHKHIEEDDQAVEDGETENELEEASLEVKVELEDDIDSDGVT